MEEFAIAAMGEDRPGIVAAVSEALGAAGASIEDSSMTILGGHFAMLLLVRAAGSAEDVERVLRPVADELALLLEVRPTQRHAPSGVERVDHVVAAYGADRPGLVAALARVLADAGVNVTDFGSRLGEAGTFAMWFNVSVPVGVNVDELAELLRDAGGEVALDVSIHEEHAEEL